MGKERRYTYIYAYPGGGTADTTKSVSHIPIAARRQSRRKCFKSFSKFYSAYKFIKEVDSNVFKRFISKVNILNEDNCWLWMAGKTSRGYGAFWFDGKDWGAHRMAYLLANGPFDMSLYVLHACDVKLCCNPKHLFLGTHLDNIQDKVNKGRQAKGEKIALPGERNGRSKLTKNDVEDIRSMFKKGISQVELAKKYNVTYQNIRYIVHYQTWIK